MNDLRPQNLNASAAVNAAILLLHAAGTHEEGQAVYSLPSDHEDEGGEHQNATGDEPTADTSGAAPTVAGSSDSNIVLAGGYGAAIIAAFIAMIKYLDEMTKQGFELTKDMATAMIGTSGHPGIIASWVDSGIKSAVAAGDQLTMQAIGYAIGAAFAAATVLAAGVGFAKNCTDGIGTGAAQTERGAVSTQLKDAQSYRNMLDQPSNAAVKAQAAEEDDLQPGSPRDAVQASPEDTMRMRQLRDGEGISNYKGRDPKTGQISDADAATERAAQHLSAEDKAKAIAAADKKVESLQSQKGAYDTKQQNWMQFINVVNQGGSSAGNAYGGIEAGQAQVEAGTQKATADALQQAAQTTEGGKEKAISTLQSNRDQMGQMAQALASALSAQVQSRA